VSQTNGQESGKAEYAKAFAELLALEERMKRDHEKRMRELRRRELISFLIILFGTGMMLLAAVLNYLARPTP